MTTDPPAPPERPIFEETQRYHMGPWWLLVAFSFSTSWYAFFRQIVQGQPFGRTPSPDWAIWLIAILFGIVMPLFFLTLRLTVRVDAAGIFVRYFPVVRRLIKVSEIRSYVAVDYDPQRDYGGWGVKIQRNKKGAYTAFGRRGVQLELKSDEKLLIGSQRADELEMAIKDARAGRA